MVNKTILRLISFMSLAALVILLNNFSDLDHETIISITIIMLFLIIFTYIFESRGPILLKMLMIIFSFIFLPLFVLNYLNIPSTLPKPWGGLTAYLIMFAIGVISIYTIFQLSYIEIEYLGD